MSSEAAMELAISLSSRYAFSPFDRDIVGSDVQIIAITVTAVFTLLFLVGLFGHCFVLGFIACQKRSPCLSAYVIIGNLTAAHLVFVVVVLPLAAYVCLMGLVTSEWLLGDLPCRLASFVSIFLLGVTTLSFYALAIDRFQSAGHVSRRYERASDSALRGTCKMLILWVGALVLSSPELLVNETSSVALPVLENSKLPLLHDLSDLPADVYVMTKQQYEAFRNADWSIRDRPNVTYQSKNKNGQSLFPNDLLEKQGLSNSTLKIYVQYETCQPATTWNESLPAALNIIMGNYVQFRDWWLLVFHFFLPVIFTLIFALLVSRRLSHASKTANDNPVLFTGSYYVTSGTNGGTLTSQREAERTTLMDSPYYRSNNTLSSHTNMGDALYQQRGCFSLDRQMSPMQYQRRLSPVVSTEDLNDASPTMVVSNGSLRTIDSSRPLGEFPPYSSISPTFPPPTGVSLLSLATSNPVGNGTIGAASLPPHGHRKSLRRSSRISKQTIYNVSRERSLNWVMVSLVVAFTITQLPIRVVSILQSQTDILTLLSEKHVELLVNLCQYLFNSTFILNPVILCLSYKPYRHFLVKRFCCG